MFRNFSSSCSWVSPRSWCLNNLLDSQEKTHNRPLLEKLRAYIAIQFEDLPLLSLTALATSFCLPVALNMLSFANEDSERKKYFIKVSTILTHLLPMHPPHIRKPYGFFDVSWGRGRVHWE